jgi:sugar O-acyltransferase (sialic acid O-acetyltransferase NeuD family)
MTKKDIILIGGGGHCKACIDVIEQEGRFQIAGIIDTKENVGKEILGYDVIGTDEQLETISNTYRYFLITLGQLTNADKRRMLSAQLQVLGVALPTIISPKAYVSKHASIGKGSVIMHHALVNAAATIGEQCIINSKSLIEHDVKVGDYCHISTNSRLNGAVSIGDECFIGSGATLIQGVQLGNQIQIGAGAVVINTITEKGTYVGIPAKKVKK